MYLFALASVLPAALFTPSRSEPPLRILVTGASRGIGRAVATELARRGHTVGLAARDRAALTTLTAELTAAGLRVEPIVLDVTDDASVTRGVAQFLAGGPCDILVNNAGRSEQCEFLTQTPAAQREDMETNYWGSIRMARAVLPSMVRRRAGRIINVSSLLGRIASPTTACYGASKAALESWSYALRAELAPLGISVTVFTAPHTDTDAGRRFHFDGVTSLPVAYTTTELLRAIDRAPRHYAASPVYRFLLRLAGFFPALLERKVGATARSQMRHTHALLRQGEQPCASAEGLDKGSSR